MFKSIILSLIYIPEICPGETYSNNKLKEEDDDLE